VNLVLANIIRTQYKRMLRLQPALSVLGSAPPEKSTEGQPAGKEPDRIGSVLRAWPIERVHSDSSAAAQGVERERTPVFQPVAKKPPAGEATQVEARERASLLEAVAKLRSQAKPGPQGMERKRPPVIEAAPKPKPQAGPTGQAAEQERASLLEAVAKLKSKASVAPRVWERKGTPVCETAPIQMSQAEVAPPAAEPVLPPAFQPVSQPEPQAKPEVAAAPAVKDADHAQKPAETERAVPPKRAHEAGQPFADDWGSFTPPAGAPPARNADYYEVLQISPNADPETVHRVYRIMAARFHPDNPTTGSLERFLALREAYRTLIDPALRAEYDAIHQNGHAETLPIFWQKAFVDGIEGETNRRLGVLSLLYHRRRVNHSKPGISAMELEQRMAFPREYLNFTLWYLRSKGYVSMMEDNSDYALTCAGVDFVETSSAKNQVIRELLTAGAGADNTRAPEPVRKARRVSPRATRVKPAEASSRVSAGSSAASPVAAAEESISA
jgi:hypothetical protein